MFGLCRIMKSNLAINQIINNKKENTMNKFKILAFIGWLAVFYACSNDPFLYNDEARIRMEGPSIWTLGTDSLEFSFASFNNATLDTTFEVTIYVMGTGVERERTALFEVGAETTADPALYSFPLELIIPEGETSAILPVTIRRKESLKEKAVQLDVKVKESADFKIGANEQNHLLIKWSDILIKPSNWNDLVEFFGDYSDVKYRFIIDVLNQASFDTDVLSWAQMKNYQIVLTEKLREYNETHPQEPLTDENGNLVEF